MCRLPELDNVIANLELLPLHMNESKNAKTGDRQCGLAKKFYQARLVSKKGLEVLLEPFGCSMFVEAYVSRRDPTHH